MNAEEVFTSMEQMRSTRPAPEATPAIRPTMRKSTSTPVQHPKVCLNEPFQTLEAFSHLADCWKFFTSFLEGVPVGSFSTGACGDFRLLSLVWLQFPGNFEGMESSSSVRCLVVLSPERSDAARSDIFNDSVLI